MREKPSKSHHLCLGTVCLFPLSQAEKLLYLTALLSLQTPLSWQELEGERASSCTHKRSASWGSTDHRKEVTAPFAFLQGSLPLVYPQHHGHSCSKVDSRFRSHCFALAFSY